MADNSINVAVCDDDPVYLKEIGSILKKIMFSYNIVGSIITFIDPNALLERITEFDLLFLDVEMPGKDGFAVARHIQNVKPTMKIVFLSSHREYIQDAFKVKAYRYLYKPAATDEICEVVDDALKEIVNVDGIVVATRDSEKYLSINNIYYIESLGDRTAMYYRNSHILTTKTLKDWMQLLKTRGFWRVHKSYAVNFANVVQVEKGKVLLSNSEHVPLSVRNYASTKEAYHNYIKSNAKRL